MPPKHEKPQNDNPLERLMIRFGLLRDIDSPMPSEEIRANYSPKHLSEEQYRSLGKPPIEMQRLNKTDTTE